MAAVGVVAVLVLTGHLIVPTAELAGIPGPASTAAPPSQVTSTGRPVAASGGGTPAVPGAPDPATVTVPPLDPAPSPPGALRMPTPAASGAATRAVSSAETAAPTLPDSAGPAVLSPLRAPYDTVLGFHGSGHVAYLTFDDGPSRYTGQVLDILAAVGVKATFCQTGSQIAGYPDVERRLTADGHTLCNHSWTHPAGIAALPAAQIDQQIGRTQQAFARLGVTVRYFRAPGGDFGKTSTTLRQLCQRYRTRPLGWSVDPQDQKKPGVTKIVQTVPSTVSPGAVILPHDGGGTDRDQTMAAIPGIISGLQGQGYTLAALPPDGPS